MKPGILPNITEKVIYFADIGDLVDYKYDLQEAKEQLSQFFDQYVEGYVPSDKIATQVYKEMTQEYERIEHLIRCTDVRISNVQNAD